jgi:hypothetical protein
MRHDYERESRRGEQIVGMLDISVACIMDLHIHTYTHTYRGSVDAISAHMYIVEQPSAGCRYHAPAVRLGV